MVAILIILLLNSLAVWAAAAILPGVKLENFMTAVVVAIILGVVNTFIRPIVLLLTLPINVLTLGLFTFVIIGFLTLMVSWIVPGFEVASFWWALLFALVLAIINTFLSSMIRPI